MLAEDPFGSARVVQSSRGFQAHTGLVVLGKSLRYLAVYSAYAALHGDDWPVLSFVWWLLTCSAIVRVGPGVRLCGLTRCTAGALDSTHALEEEQRIGAFDQGRRRRGGALRRSAGAQRHVRLRRRQVLWCSPHSHDRRLWVRDAPPTCPPREPLLTRLFFFFFSDLPVVYLAGAFLGRFSICKSAAARPLPL